MRIDFDRVGDAGGIEKRSLTRGDVVSTVLGVARVVVAIACGGLPLTLLRKLRNRANALYAYGTPTRDRRTYATCHIDE